MKKTAIAFLFGTILSSGAYAQEGYTQLFDGKTLPDWTQVGKTNWRIEDGAIVADKREGDSAAFLLSKQKYKDFQMIVEFWSSEDANSGIFFRCSQPENLGDRTCYEANIFDKRPDPTYGTGGIVHHAEVDPMPKAAGKWNTMEITAKGRDLLVSMNGQKTSGVRNGLFVEGPVALQHGSGAIKFRKIAIKPL